MSWNRKGSKKEEVKRKKASHFTFSVLRFTFYIVPLALAFGVALWWMMRQGGGSAAPAHKAPRSGAIGIDLRTSPKAAKSAGLARATGGGPAAARPVAPTNKVELTKNVRPPTVLGCNYYECVSGGRPLFAKPIFTNSAENIIGGLLSARPGERFLPVDLGEDFDMDFEESLKSPIVIKDDDSIEDALIKEAVIKAKEQIAAGMESGQKPSEVVMSMRDEMNRIADYRDLLQEDFDKMKETADAEKIMSYLREANMLLDEFGAERLDLPEDEIEEISKRLSDAGQNQKEAGQ